MVLPDSPHVSARAASTRLEQALVLGIALALGASLCWGASDFLGGLRSRRLGVLRVMLGVQLLALAPIAVLVAVSGDPFPSARSAVAAGLAGLVGLGALSALYGALAAGTMSLVAPISATGAAVPVVVGLATGDQPSPLQDVGLLVALGGVVLAARQEDHSVPGHHHGDHLDRDHLDLDDRDRECRDPDYRDRARFTQRRSVGLALASALGFGCFFLGTHVAVQGGVPWMLLLSRLAVLPLLAGAVAASGPGVLPQRGELPFLAAISALDGLATGLFALANRHGLVSVVSVVGSLYPVGTLLLARALLHERLRPGQALGVAGALAGVALISAG